MIKCPPNQPVMYGFNADYSKIDSPFTALELVGINEVTFTSVEMSDDISASLVPTVLEPLDYKFTKNTTPALGLSLNIRF